LSHISKRLLPAFCSHCRILPTKADDIACSARRSRLALSKKEKQFAVLLLPALPECGSILAFSRRTHVPATPRLRYPDGIPAEGINV
jgi:hypothetical protein